MRKAGYIATASHLPESLQNQELQTDKKKKEGISRQAKSSWEQDSLAISIEPKPKRIEKVPIRQSTHLNLSCQARAPSLSPIPINSYAPSNRHAESPSRATADGWESFVLISSSNSLELHWCHSSKFAPKLELYYFTVQKSAGFLKELQTIC